MEALSLALDRQNSSRYGPGEVNLLDVISISPLLERLARLLPFGSLLSLSRTNSTYRAILHGFSIPSSSSLHSSHNEDAPSISETETLCSDDNGSFCFTDSDTICSVDDFAQDTKDGGVRPGLKIGWHQTELWKKLKSTSMMECSETFHKRGKVCKTCRICSMPVCEACIMKLSFSRMGSAYNTRERHLCDGCFESGNPHGDKLRYGPDHGLIDYKSLRRCICTARDGFICAECRDLHFRRHYDRVWLCAGYKCQKTIERVWGVRVCSWCNGSIPGHRNREDYWLAFDVRFAESIKVENSRLRLHYIGMFNDCGEQPRGQGHCGIIKQPPLPGHQTSLGRVCRNGRYDYWHLLPRRGVPKISHSQIVQEEQSKSKDGERINMAINTS